MTNMSEGHDAAATAGEGDAANASATAAPSTRWLDSRNKVLLAATTIGAIGLALGGWFAGSGLVRMREAERAVTVRGVAERDVVADLATWTVTYSSTAGTLDAARADNEADTRAVYTYFEQLGFPAAALQSAGGSVNQYDSNGVPTVTVTRRVQFRSTDIVRAGRAATQQFRLIERGVSLADGSTMNFTFTGLNAIKPAMIAAATRDARRAAEQFARDSGSGVGQIRSATQGYFEITARDGESGGYGVSDTPNKRVRVVTTVEYSLD